MCIGVVHAVIEWLRNYNIGLYIYVLGIKPKPGRQSLDFDDEYSAEEEASIQIARENMRRRKLRQNAIMSELRN